ncbi:energy transducer TonB [Pelagicoccus sp. NFK12]|uniref:Energy transducer TonB n=1 Tax=Pelagicoccus enzymogenes TaxID=2773457 RepID=A0A927F8V3_9BACT|nr:energy transducer TonB [Pelagicoccus enzymogenes]MBD5779300.1 energy transducer TonB [Pelagicoccus enzymogenes]MDQ8198348.1 energy transducer TonB [Pelagicoccus enzymogenes]
MNRHPKNALLCILLLLQAGLLAEPEQEIVRYRADSQAQLEFQITQTKDPIFPNSLKLRGFMEGNATFAIFINQFGELEDFLLVEASHIDFAKAAEKAIPDWRFSVPRVDGEVAAIASKIRINFERGNGVVYETIGYEPLLPGSQLIKRDSESYRVYTLDELDSIPIPSYIAKPSFHDEMLEERNVVNAVFQFYIDTEGNVRIPTLREADDLVDERLLLIAQEALLQWKFEPPMRDNRPVVARAAQPFRFKKKDSRLPGR